MTQTIRAKPDASGEISITLANHGIYRIQVDPPLADEYEITLEGEWVGPALRIKSTIKPVSLTLIPSDSLSIPCPS